MFWTANGEQVKQIYDKDELAVAVTNTIEYYEETNKRLEAVNKKLMEDAKEVVRAQYEQQITNLQHQLSMSYGHFSSQKELDRYKDFEKRHMHNRETSRANGGKAPYLIPTGTGIGIILHVKCPICGEEEEILMR